MEQDTFRYDDEKTQSIGQHIEEILKLVGEDPSREGLEKTPKRVGKAFQFLTQGYEQDPKSILQSAIFEAPNDNMVVVKDIEFYSLCEHHLLPFFGKCHVAYIPKKKITGLSKIARVVDVYARRFQVQERLTDQILHCIDDTLDTQGVMVVIEAEHLCMQMRGVQKQHSITITSGFTGCFENMDSRQELMALLKQ